MTGISDALTFADDFPPVSTEAWEAKIQEDLKGADYEKKLVWKTIDGLQLRPYYRQEDLDNKPYLQALPGAYPFIRGNDAQKGWQVQQDIEVKNPAAANAKALDALSKGAQSVALMLSSPLQSPAELGQLLENIDLSATPVHFRLAQDHYTFFEWFVQHLKNVQVDSHQVHGSLNMSPLSKLTAAGNFFINAESDFKILAGTLKKYGPLFPHFRFIPVEGYLFVEAGASVVQELGFSLSMASDYLAGLTDEGLTVDEIAPHIQLNFGISPDYFPEIAKIRAARWLWARIVKAYGASSIDLGKVHIHSTTSRWNKTLYDAYVNMLRLTTESMSAVIGGCDSLSVRPFDEVFGRPSGFTERIARNTQIILKEEAQFNKTVDPSAGSYYIENLTDALANEAWHIFQQTEKKGGYLKQFLAGEVRDKIKETARKKDMHIATRREVLLGTNQYPNAAETLKDEVKAVPPGPFYKEAPDALCSPLKMYRGAEAFEALRVKTDRMPERPKVFLLTIGNLNWRKARASFAYGFFACAGYEIIDNPGFQSVNEGVEAARQAGAHMVVICSSDDEYAYIATPIYEKLKDRAIVVVAGLPACAEELKQQGIQYFIHVKSNLLESLREFHQKLGIK